MIERPEPDPGGVPSPAYSITDEKTGEETRELLSFDGSVNLKPYVGDRVLVFGRQHFGTRPLRFLSEALDVNEVYPLGEDGETVEVTFELEIDGEVPERRFFHLEVGPHDPSSRDAFFCGFDRNAGAFRMLRHFEQCEDGRIYRAISELPADQPISFEFVRISPDAASDERSFESFYSDTRTFTEDDTVAVTYTVPEDSEGGFNDSGKGVESPDTPDASHCERSYEEAEQYREEQPEEPRYRLGWEQDEGTGLPTRRSITTRQQAVDAYTACQGREE